MSFSLVINGQLPNNTTCKLYLMYRTTLELFEWLFTTNMLYIVIGTTFELFEVCREECR